MSTRTYKVGHSKITLIFGDITTSKAQVLVSSDDYWLHMGGGVSKAVHRAGGSRIKEDALKLVPARAGNVVVTTAGDLSSNYIFHAITIGENRHDVPHDAIVRQTTLKCLELLSALGCRSIAFPAIGAGVAGIDYKVVASEMAGSLVEFLLDYPKPLDIELYLLDHRGDTSQNDLFIIFEEFAARTLALTSSKGDTTALLSPPPGKSSGMTVKQAEDAQRRHQIYTMLRHLDSRRTQLENALVKVLVDGTPEQIGQLTALRIQLDEIQALRNSYQAELLVTEAQNEPVPSNSVFVSSTYLDLKPHRLAIRSVIDKLKCKYVGMEDFVPTAQAPATHIRQKVLESKIYLGVFGMRYGYVDTSTGFSMTELEYRQAIASKKDICIFVMDKNAPITVDMIEDNPEAFAKLRDFKNRVLCSHICGFFTDAADLAQKVETALKKTLQAS